MAYLDPNDPDLWRLVQRHGSPYPVEKLQRPGPPGDPYRPDREIGGHIHIENVNGLLAITGVHAPGTADSVELIRVTCLEHEEEILERGTVLNGRDVLLSEIAAFVPGLLPVTA